MDDFDGSVPVGHSAPAEEELSEVLEVLEDEREHEEQDDEEEFMQVVTVTKVLGKTQGPEVLLVRMPPYPPF